jgi:hypothetical protein
LHTLFIFIISIVCDAKVIIIFYIANDLFYTLRMINNQIIIEMHNFNFC